MRRWILYLGREVGIRYQEERESDKRVLIHMRKIRGREGEMVEMTRERERLQRELADEIRNNLVSYEVRQVGDVFYWSINLRGGIHRAWRTNDDRRFWE